MKFYLPYPLIEQDYDIIIKWFELVRHVLVYDPKKEDIVNTRDVGFCGAIIIPDDDRQGIQNARWSFEPKLGYEIEPTLTKAQFEDILTRVSAPIGQ